MFKRATLSLRLCIALSVVLVFFAVLIGVSYSKIGHLTHLSSLVKTNTEANSFLLQKEVDHLKWVLKVSLAINDHKVPDVEQDPHKCGFGAWLYSSLEKNDYPPAVVAVLKDIEPIHANLHASVISIAKNLSDKNAVKEIFHSQTIQSLHGVQDKFKEIKARMHEHMIATAGTAAEDIVKTASFAQQFVLVFGIIAMIIASILMFLISRSIVLTLAGITNELRDSALQVGSASKEVSKGSQSVSQASSEQAASIEETSASLEEISGQVNNNLDTTKKSVELAQNVVNVSAKANVTVERLTQAMSSILTGNDKIGSLVKIIDHIGEKTEIMDEIVFQTKLLSFNASVEAERAGEHGRGFAVVAQEVGNLAQMSGKAAQEIAQIVKDSIREAEAVASENKKSVEEGNKYVESTTTVLQDIRETAKSLLEGANQVFSASKEQASGIKQINLAISQLDKAIQENASTSEEAAAASEELSAQSEMMNQIVEHLTSLVKGESSPSQVESKRKRSFKDRIRSAQTNASNEHRQKIASVITSEASGNGNGNGRNENEEWDRL